MRRVSASLCPSEQPQGRGRACGLTAVRHALASSVKEAGEEGFLPGGGGGVRQATKGRRASAGDIHPLASSEGKGLCLNAS